MDDRLQLIIGGQEVEGRFLHRSDSFIEVEITAPYSGFRAALHMASFSRERMPQGFRGDEGAMNARKILRQLYRLGAYIEKNRGRLLDAYQEYLTLERQVPNGLSDEFFVRLKEAFKADLEAGKISKEEYHQRMTEGRMGHSKYHERKYVMQQEFFRMNFPFKLTPSLQTQVLEYLWREIHSTLDRGLGSGEL